MKVTTYIAIWEEYGDFNVKGYPTARDRAVAMIELMDGYAKKTVGVAANWSLVRQTGDLHMMWATCRLDSVDSLWLAESTIDVEFPRPALILDGVTRYDTPIFDDIGMQQHDAGAWVKVADLYTWNNASEVMAARPDLQPMPTVTTGKADVSGIVAVPGTMIGNAPIMENVALSDYFKEEPYVIQDGEMVITKKGLQAISDAYHGIKEKLEERRVLVLSTGHVTNTTGEFLNTTNAVNDWPMVGGNYGVNGWFFYCHDENMGDGESHIPDDLFAVMQFARARGFEHVLFDCDAEQVEGLPFWEW